MITVNFLSISEIEIHFEVVADNGATYYYRVFTDTITANYPAPIGVDHYPPEYVTKAASVAIKKVYAIINSVRVSKAFTADNLKTLSYNKYKGVDLVRNAAINTLARVV